MPNPPLLTVHEVPRPLLSGDHIPDQDGDMALVLEVTALQSTQHGRQLYACLHAGAGSILVFVCPRGGQTEWSRS